MNGRIWIIVGGLAGAAGVMLGAYAAHGLEKQLLAMELDPSVVVHRMQNCEVAVRYQMYSSLALLGVGLLSVSRASRLLTAAGVLITAGTLLFSGGLYLIVFTGESVSWAIVPLGGMTLILGWLAIAASGLQKPQQS